MINNLKKSFSFNLIESYIAYSSPEKWFHFDKELALHSYIPYIKYNNKKVIEFQWFKFRTLTYYHLG